MSLKLVPTNPNKKRLAILKQKTCFGGLFYLKPLTTHNYYVKIKTQQGNDRING